MYIYIICPVRLSTPETTSMVEKYVAELESKGHKVFWPQRDVEQEDDPTGLNIVNTELCAIENAHEVHVFWDKNSKGSHFDLGAAMVLRTPVKLIHSFFPDDDGKSYQKVIEVKESERF